MIFRPYLHTEPTVAISYLLGCGGKSSAVVVDPVLPAPFYLEEAQKLGMKILYVIDTHLHADHLSTALELSGLAGAPYVLHESATANYDFYHAKDGESLRLGNVELTLWHTPGHTPEHLSVLVTDHTRLSDPWMILTGHTLMVGDVGRTELATDLRTGASDLFDSIGRIKGLPDHLEIYPGAFSGSVCGRKLSGKPFSTIGFEKRANKLLAVEDRETFIQEMTLDVPPPPENFEQTRRTNLGL